MKETWTPLPAGELHAQSRSRSRRTMARWTPVAVAGLLTVSLFTSFPTPSWTFDSLDDVVPKEATWGDIPSTRNITWHSCYSGKYDCARLDVPMDWLEPTDDLRVVLAVVRLRATDKDNYHGPIFFNPGGPGGSGIYSMLDHGELLQSVVGTSYDIITFDPRGIGSSTPRIDCWSSAQNYHFWNLQDVGVVDAHPDTLYEAYTRMAAYSQMCETAMDASQILYHSSTASHARDMLEILTQLGEDKLKYWGFSYGTLLGGTFAAMYPDKIERLVSDGNVDYREWYDKEHLNFLHDADKVMQAFFDLCHAAGPGRCALYASTPADIRKRVEGVLAALKKHPVVVRTNKELGPDLPNLVTYSRLRRFMSSTLYQPQRMFVRFAEIVAALERGDGRPFYDFYSGSGSLQNAVCQAESVSPTLPLPGLVEGNDDAFPAIMCADSVPPPDTVEAFSLIVKDFEAMSYAAGAVNVLFPIHCVNRKVRAKWRFAGPYGASNTSFPILFVANMADNVTPLISARNNSAGFPSSVVLVQQSYGHTSLSAPSTCTAKAIRNYFQHGILPQPDTKCQPNMLPFDLPAPASESVSGVDAADAELAASLLELSERVGRMRSLTLPV
ncbi:alpha beta hydrolase fold family [Ophiostoma piceae UAMH 11346]|uniref:Alpha beta hydrolase fold family n=1 Tax=Ophiostoma piceae (strain UAMH 11346) TaxID=1262450 RepID=S3BYC1_OPHP1|nr:alpha beta hydrolase fold family [Ophiostoma piceae UAMH 11346]